MASAPSQPEQVQQRPRLVSAAHGPASPAPAKPKLLDQLRQALRSRLYSPWTEKTYSHWVKRFIYFHHIRHPAEMAELEEHLANVRRIHEQNPADRWGRVLMPDALDRKYPNAPADWRWQSVFPQENRRKNVKTGQQRRHHVDQALVKRAVRAAVHRAGLTKRATGHAFRHSLATHLLEAPYDIGTVQEPVGRRDVKTPMIYTQVLNRRPSGVRSPADSL